MDIEKFWNQAFLAALARVPPKTAKKQADEALEMCIKHWQSHRKHWAPRALLRWQDQSVSLVPQPIADIANEQRKLIRKKGSNVLSPSQKDAYPE